MDLTKALAPKSDQIDAADLIGQPPQIFTIASVSENGSELADQQPVNIRLEETNKFYRPSKGMLRVLADKWGKNVADWVGRQVELYGEPEVYFGKEKRGGTRISRMSHLPNTKPTLINPRGGKGAYWTVDPLPDAAPPTPKPLATQIADMVSNYDSTFSVTRSQLETHLALPVAEWTAETLDALRVLGGELKRGEKNVADVFGAGS